MESASAWAEKEVVDTPQRRVDEDHTTFQSGLGLFGASRMILYSICKCFDCIYSTCILC
jgi:hypothetical protein